MMTVDDMMKFWRAALRLVSPGCLMVSLASLYVPVAYSAVEKQGLALQSTRVIYPASATGGVSFSIANNTPIPYLIQSRVRDWDANLEVKEQAVAPFIALPPLEKLAAGDMLNLRIRLMRNDLPQDRESVFSLALKAIPAQKNQTVAALTLATQHQFKLFYRPVGLSDYNTEQIAAKLRFHTQNHQLKVENPTPYYATFATLTIGGKPVDTAQAAMLPPFGQQTYSISDVGKGAIIWQLIDDDGVATLEHRQP